MTAPEPLLPNRQALGTVLVSRTILSELAQVSAQLEDLGFAETLGGQVVLIRPKLDMPVIARRVLRLEGDDRVCVEESENGSRTYALRCVLDAEPSEQQWRGAVAELCSRLLQGQARHFTMQELRQTAERTARMYECWQELDTWQRASSSTASSADAAGTLPVRLVNGLARILQSPADAAAMSLIWAAWEMHLQPWTESGARQLGGEGTTVVTQLPASASAARVAAPPAQEAAAVMHYPDVDAHADLQQPRHQQPRWQQPNKKPPQVIIGGDPDDNRPQAGHLDTWPPTPSPPGSSACKSHESGDEHDEETMDGPGSSGLPHTSQAAAPVGRGDTEGGPYAWQQQVRGLQGDEEGGTTVAGHQWLGYKDSRRSRDALDAARGAAAGPGRQVCNGYNGSRSHSPSSSRQARRSRSLSPQQARRDAAARPQFTEEDQKWVERLHQWLLRQPQREAAYDGPNSDMRMSVPKSILERLGMTITQFYVAWPDLFAVDHSYVKALEGPLSTPATGKDSASNWGRPSTSDLARPPAWSHVVREPRRSSEDGGRKQGRGDLGPVLNRDRERGRERSLRQSRSRSRSRSQSPQWREEPIHSSRSGRVTPRGRPSRQWEEPQNMPASMQDQAAEDKEERQWAERVHQFLLTRPRLEASAGTLLKEGLGVPQHFLDRKGMKLFWFLDSFKDLWTLEVPAFANKQAVLLHAVPKHQQPAADIAVGVAIQETEGQYVRRLYQHLLEKLPLGVEMNNLKGGRLRIPSHLFGGSYRTVSAFLRHWRDVGLWRMSEDRPLVLTARTGGRVQEVLEGLH